MTNYGLIEGSTGTNNHIVFHMLSLSSMRSVAVFLLSLSLKEFSHNPLNVEAFKHLGKQ
jgi:hypothetical protein